MRPQDIVILLKILCYGSRKWYSKELAKDLQLSSSEVSNALERNAVSGVIDTSKRKVRTEALLDFLIYGLPYVFPQRPGGMSRGMPTAHSHPAFRDRFISDTIYVWPDADSDERGMVIQPLYSGVPYAALADEQLYLMLALIDILRVGKAREKKMAIGELKKLLQA